MTKEDMVQVLRSVGVNENTITAMCNAFDMGVAYEREACANLCDELQAPPHVSDDDMSMWDVTSMECADAIRARGNA
jgi:hypothetical protein